MPYEHPVLGINRNAITAAFTLACLGIRSRNEEAINSTRNRIYTCERVFTSYFIDVEYSSGYLLFICFWTDLVCVLATTGNTSAFASFHLYKYMKIQGRQFQRNYIVHHCQRSKGWFTFQSSPKITRMLITKAICIQWKFTSPDHRSFANYDSNFFDHSVVFTCSRVINPFKRQNLWTNTFRKSPKFNFS